MKKGFTLIELLVVITLIGILAVAVLSAINPIEQINKARDAAKRSDASQLISGLDRYFASNLKFPWNQFDNYSTSTDLAFIASARAVGVGVCTNGSLTDADLDTGSDASGCTPIDSDNDGNTNNYGFLIETQELKSQFAKRAYFKDSASLTDADQLFVIKPAGDPSVSICFVPQSKALRDTWDDTIDGTKVTKLKDLGMVGDPPLPVAITQWVNAAAPDYTSLTTSAFVCLPEE